MPNLKPPRAARVPVERFHHGDVVIDNYEWLRKREDPRVIAHLEAENAFTARNTAHLDELRTHIFDEIKSRTQETDMSVPTREGGYWYYSRTIEGQQYSLFCRRAVVSSEDWTPPIIDEDTRDEEILLDGNQEAEGHDFFSLGSVDVSTDGKYLLYATDVVGDERYTLRVRDLATRENLPDEIVNTAAGALFSPDSRFIFYPTVDHAWRPDTVWRHAVGEATPDTAVFTEPDERFWIGVGITRSRRYLVIEIGSKVTSETRLLDANTPDGEFLVVWPRRDGVEYSVDHAMIGGEDRLVIVHNDGCENFELVDVPPHNPGTRASDGRVLVPASDAIRLEGVDAFEQFITVEYRRDGLTRIAVIPNPHGPFNLLSHELTFDESLFTVGLGPNPEWSQPALRVGYGSFVTPSTVYDFDVARAALTQLKQQPVLGDYNPADYEQRREWATASDGTRIPISLVWRRAVPGFTRDSGTSQTRARPLELYGYGSYEASLDPGLSIPRLSLLDRGVVFAIAHVRGGGELGRAWYDHGKGLEKVNTFTDFVDAACHLISKGWTTKDILVAEGGSAGGLLMGAVANRAPELFAGILAEVPFVDPLTSILDASLPLTQIEWDEWGDPLNNPDVYHYMKAYSPYENVREGVAYPRILATTSLNDTRVLYAEPAKWAARLRDVGAPVLLKTEMAAGHGGVSGRYAQWHERAYELAWLLDVLGLNTK